MATKKTVKPYVLVRAYSAGIHVGVLERKEGNEVTLSDTRRIWYWRGAFTCSELSQSGPASGSKISAAVPENTIREWIEIIPVSAEAEKRFREIEAHRV